VLRGLRKKCIRSLIFNSPGIIGVAFEKLKSQEEAVIYYDKAVMINRVRWHLKGLRFYNYLLEKMNGTWFPKFHSQNINSLLGALLHK
jgi:hypothetical protein